MRLLTTLGVLATLAGCSNLPDIGLADLGGAFSGSVFQNAAFAPADVQILAPSAFNPRSFSLRACGATVCGSRAATITQSANGAVISGAYPGTTFTLAPGGAGTLTTSAGVTEIVWDYVD